MKIVLFLTSQFFWGSCVGMKHILMIQSQQMCLEGWWILLGKGAHCQLCTKVHHQRKHHVNSWVMVPGEHCDTTWLRMSTRARAKTANNTELKEFQHCLCFHCTFFQCQFWFQIRWATRCHFFSSANFDVFVGSKQCWISESERVMNFRSSWCFHQHSLFFNTGHMLRNTLFDNKKFLLVVCLHFWKIPWRRRTNGISLSTEVAQIEHLSFWKNSSMHQSQCPPSFPKSVQFGFIVILIYGKHCSANRSAPRAWGRISCSHYK